METKEISWEKYIQLLSRLATAENEVIRLKIELSNVLKDE